MRVHAQGSVAAVTKRRSPARLATPTSQRGHAWVFTEMADRLLRYGVSPSAAVLIDREKLVPVLRYQPAGVDRGAHRAAMPSAILSASA